MANISITNACNKCCAYCFAEDARKEYGNSHMDLSTYKKALDLLERSEIKQVRLLGGEPTLHPDFINFIKIAHHREFNIMLFTNGLLTTRTLDFLCTLPKNKVSILLNTIHPREKNINGINQQKTFMERLGPAITPGINIYSPAIELDYISPYVKKYNLKPTVRLGIAHNTLSKENIFLHPKDYPKIGIKIAEFKEKVRPKNINLKLDCGFVPCMFPPESYALLKEEIENTGTCCHPILDMLSDGSFISCYPLNSRKKINLNPTLTTQKLIHEFSETLEIYSDIGIYPNCTSCPLFRNRCNGGCMSFRIQRYFN